MTIQTLFDSWSEVDPSVAPPATEAEIQAAEAKIGATLPSSLREVYLLFNGGWWWELNFFPLEPDLTNANEMYIEWGWHIPHEIRLFASEGGSDVFGVWLPDTGNPIYNHPIIEVGSITGEGCMGVTGTNLISFLRGWSAYYLLLQEDDELEEGGEKWRRIQTALDRLQVPQWFRAESFDESQYEATCAWDDPRFTQLRKWADPQLPDPYGDSYT